MAKLVYALQQSLDGYVDHLGLGPCPGLFRHSLEHLRGLAGLACGRGLYEVMGYWDEDQPEWDDGDREFAAAWRALPKWVLSNSLPGVGPNATLVPGDAVAAVRRLKAEVGGEVDVGGPGLAHSLTAAGLIDEYWLYLRPVVLGRGRPFFAGPRPPLRLAGHEVVAEDVIRLVYVPQ